MKLPKLKMVRKDLWELEESFQAPFGPCIPKGFLTDLMTSPKWVEHFGIGDKYKDQYPACVVHDYECENPTQFPRYKADYNLLRNLLKYGCPYSKSLAIFGSVRLYALFKGK